jgi:hypothetical protein
VGGGHIPSPSRENLAAWINECLNVDLNEDMVMNAWNGPGDAYYFDENLEQLAFDEEAVPGNDDMIVGNDDNNDEDKNDLIFIFHA